MPAQIHTQNESVNRYMLAAFILSEPILDALRREIRKFADVKPDNDQLAEILESDVIKRDTLDGEKAEAAAKRVSRYVAKTRRTKPQAVAISLAQAPNVSQLPVTVVILEPNAANCAPPASA